MSRKGENIYKRKDGRWEGRIRKPDGKYHSIYAKTYREVREKMKSTKAGLEDPLESSIRSCNYLAPDMFEAWLIGELSNRVKPTTYESYYQCIKKYVLPHFRQLGNEYLTEFSVVQFVKDIRQNTTLSEASRRKILSIFKIAMREIAKNMSEYTPLLENITLPQVKSCKDIPVFNMKEQRRIECAVKNSQDRRVLGVIICLYTGIRIGELCALTWNDFDLEAGIMSISKTVSRIKNFESNVQKTQLHVSTPKSRTSVRRIPLPAFLQEMVWKSQQGITKENCNILSGRPEPFDPRVYQRLYKKLLKEAGVKDRKFHALRHSFATRALELGVDMKTLSEILGHANVNITLNIYAHSLMEQKKIAIEKFNNMYVTRTKPAPFAVNSLVKELRSSS